MDLLSERPQIAVLAFTSIQSLAFLPEVFIQILKYIYSETTNI